MPVPQAVPLALLSLSVQTDAPVAQAMVPARHGLLGTSHELPAAHVWHAPLRQTPLSHVVPLVCGRIVSRHDDPPDAEHVVSPI
jgi:hypothetical protein